MYARLLLISLCWNLILSCTFAQDPELILSEKIQAMDHEEVSQVFLEEIEAELRGILDRPIDLNTGQLSLLSEAGIITTGQVLAIEQHKAKFGPLLSFEELQVSRAFTIDELYALRPFVVVDKSVSPAISDPVRLFSIADHHLLLRYSGTVEKADAYQEKKYPGSPGRLYMRYRMQAGRYLRVGLTGEKDAGEEFFQGNRKDGFDFYSGFVFLEEPVKVIKSCVAGDFSMSMGQGLIMHNGFGFGKSVFVTQVKKGAGGLRPYSSVLESGYFRGIGASLRLPYRLEGEVFYSKVRRDANILADTVLPDNGEPRIIRFSSLQQSGLHRTQAEQEDRKSLKQRNLGLRIGKRTPWFDVHLNVLHEHYDKVQQPAPGLYNLFKPSGQDFLNFSLDYGITWNNLQLFGEIASDNSFDIAVVSGLLITLGPKVDLALHGRYVPVQYYSPNANFFAETSTGNNERGLYSAIVIRPLKGLEISAYSDSWYHPWLRFTSDAPSRGRENFVKISYGKRRKWSLDLQFKSERKELNGTNNDRKLDGLEERLKNQLRMHFKRNISRDLEFRSRVEYTLLTFEGEKEQGLLIAQDILFKPIGKPYSCTFRSALFSTGGYNSRVYAYENNIAYAGSVSAFSDEGLRYYLNLRYKGLKHISIESRIARTIYTNVRTIGSGNDEIQGRVKTEFALQLMMNF